MDFMPDFITDFVVDTLTWLTEMANDAEGWQQFLVIMLAGAIPFIESYVAGFLGVLVGVPAPLAVTAAVAGNLVCMLVLTALTSGARTAVIRGRRSADDGGVAVVEKPSKSQRRVGRYVERLGVPGVCLLTPLVLPTMITAPILVGFGAKPRFVYFWMTVSIIAWGVLFGFFGEWVAGWFF